MSGRSVGIVAVQRHRVERRRQPLRRHAVGQQVEALVGAERVAFAGEHARRILVLALEREHAGGEREAAGHVLAQLPAQDLAVVLVARQRDLADLACRTATSCVSAVRISLSRIFTTYSSPA